MIRSWTFQKKITIAFAVMVGLVAATTAIGIYALGSTAATLDKVTSVNGQNMIQATQLATSVYQSTAAFRGYVAEPDERFLQELASARQDFLAVFKRLQHGVESELGKRRMEEIAKTDEAWRTSAARAIALRRQKGGLQLAQQVMREETLLLRDHLIDEINGFVELEQRLLAEAKASAASQASFSRVLLICVGVIAVVFAALTALFLGRSLSRQVGAAVQHVQSSSAELQSSANQQASGTKEAATAMNEITTTVSELLATSRQIAESAQQVTHIAEETAKAASGGDHTVLQSQQAIEAIRRQVDLIVNHMLNLGAKSQQIGTVLDLINELAEQTNILSINASIEAAGAGEQGKRFAVVGEEIRKLADRVSGSTKEIRALVEEIRAAVNTTILATETGSKAVDAGLHRFEEVTRCFKEIASMVVTTTQAAREIGMSTKQQMTAVEQVNTAISGAAQASREAEASSAQTLQTAVELAHLSQSLSRIVVAPAA